MLIRCLVAGAMVIFISGCLQPTPEQRAEQEAYLETYSSRAGYR